MRARLAHGVLLVGSVAFLASLYFTWVASNAFTQFNGWGVFGQVAAALAVALALAAFAALVRPHLAGRLPFGMGALALGIFALLDGADVWRAGVGVQNASAELAPAAYVGLAAAGVVTAAAAALRSGQGIQRPSPVMAMGQLLSLGVIASFLLQALDAREWALGPLGTVGPFICAVACLGVWAWSRAGTPMLRLALAAALVILVVAHRLPIDIWTYEEWLLLPCTLGLLALSLLAGRGLRLHRPAASDMWAVAAGVLLLVSLFLPWQAECSEGCGVLAGWAVSPLAGVSVLVLLVGLVAFGRFLPEFAIGAAIFAATMFGSNLQFGAMLGLPAAALLLLAGLPSLRPVLNWRFFVRLVPAIAALGLIALDLAPLGGTRLSQFAVQSPWKWFGLLAAIATVVTIRLFARWCTRPRDSAEVVLLPLGLLALTALDLIYVGAARYAGDPAYISNTRFADRMSWEGWISIGLCLLLLACGWVERYGGGLERFGAPQPTWRVDRLPAVED